ncbi:MAG: MvdC/MvdD family ATP grasp protein [Solirubrobacteraceae bacterium]
MPSILIITNDHDEHADAVIRELNARDVPVFRFHPEEFPDACSLSIDVDGGRVQGVIRSGDDAVALEDICAAWYRRARNLFEGRRLSLTSEKLDNYVRAQSTATLAALCECLETLWVGHPYKLRRAEVTALQLLKASEAGLTTPHTLISNDQAEVKGFVDRLGDAECAIKPLVAVGVTDAQGYRLPLTTTLPPGHSLDSVAAAPSIFQPYVDKAFELRCVVIGERIFAAKIHSQATEATRRDWRAGEPEHEIFALPEGVEASIHRLMASFQLNFASLDMIVTPDGEFVFLELNPNGQWLWLELELGLPLVASMADLLTTRFIGAGRPRPLVSEGEREVAHAS